MKSHLEVEAPSATTISYVVTSNKRPKPRLFALIGIAVRFALIFHILLVNLSKAQSTATSEVQSRYTEALFKLTVLDGFINALAASFEWWAVSVASMAVLWLCLRRPYTGEGWSKLSLCGD
jgi:hypothetical protein